MKIVENTDQRLVIADRPVFLAGMVWLMGGVSLFAAVFETGEVEGVWTRLLVGGIGLGACWLAWAFMPCITVTFDRARGAMVHQSHRMLRPGWFTLDLDRILRARLEANWSENTRLTRVVLEIDGDVVPLEYGFGSARRDEIAEAINEWLTRPI
ncbi:hypothetical protein KHP62_10320 [Rhodobacteraceae bacterium NNCM2]|nr:hypothetical protein [Coraliihabitans acroporae]